MGGRNWTVWPPIQLPHTVFSRAESQTPNGKAFLLMGLFVSVSIVAAETGTRVLYFIDAQEAASLDK